MENELTTADVYETASLIGKDIEQIIELYGHSAVVDLMPKVVEVLEQLEICVGERENCLLELEGMRLQNERLLVEVKKEASLRRTLDEEYYQYKQQTTSEITALNSLLEKLRDENQSLHDEEKAHQLEKKGESNKLTSADIAVLQQMKSTIDDQRDVIRSKSAEVNSVKSDLEAMEEQIERLANVNETIRHNLTVQKSRNTTLIQEKADLEADIKVLQQQLTKNTNVADISRLHNEFHTNVNNDVGKLKKKENVEVSPLSKDPNRPRFTLKEMQRILKERNELKEKVITLQEDLAFYKKTNEDEVDSASLKMNISSNKTKGRTERHSGISKLFKFLWKEDQRTPQKPGNISIDDVGSL